MTTKTERNLALSQSIGVNVCFQNRRLLLSALCCVCFSMACAGSDNKPSDDPQLPPRDVPDAMIAAPVPVDAGTQVQPSVDAAMHAAPDAQTAMTSDASISADAGDAAQLEPAPVSVTGPITGGKGTPNTTSLIPLAEHGYVEQEFFLDGNATAYKANGTMGMDGKWDAVETTKAPYKTRVLVRRPKDAAKFNGTVIVEWLNVSAGVDGDPGWIYAWEEIVREGYAWVGVSAQQQGVQGGGVSIPIPGPPRNPLTTDDPARYGSLTHPGDDYSYDIFTQAGLVIRRPGAIDVLNGLRAKRLMAYGESQSAFRMISYVDGIHPLAKTYDGFFIHSRSAAGTALDSTQGAGPAAAHFIRTDLDVPVMQFLTETDLITFSFFKARQPDSDRLRTWEVAGTSHADQHILDVQGADLGCSNVNSGPQHFVIKAAVHALNLWMIDGKLPAQSALLSMNAPGSAYLQDANGNSLGGIRTPSVDVPISTLSSQAPAFSSFVCSLFGSTTPFTAQKLKQLYATHQSYVDQVTAAAHLTLTNGFLLPQEEATMVTDAKAAAIPQ